MDSSSIVCMADTIVARGAAETPRLDTLSCYDDSEPNWNERPYFTRIEERRGRSGCHINVGEQHSFNFDFADDRFMASPGSTPGPASEANRQIAACMTTSGNRVVLSGIGGDEVMGGVPTPTPELEDLLRTGHFRTLAHQLKVWALQKRKPWLHLLFEAAGRFFPRALVGAPEHRKPAAWLNPSFVKRNRHALQAYESRIKLLGPPPTFQESQSTLHALQRQLACSNQSAEPPYEKRYPYLDRSLLEFIYSIPREQLVRPGQRRSLMRRALMGIVPEEILIRKRKAFVARAPLAAISAQCTHFTDMTQQMVCSLLGVVEAETFLKVLKMARHGQEIPTVTVLRTLNIECWLRNLQHCRIPVCIEGHTEDLRKGLAPSPFSAEEN
jgi:asparagine synthase (glutamine-hydrolysing)